MNISFRKFSSLFSLLVFCIPFLAGCPDEDPPEDLCKGVICDDPPEPYCDGNTAVTYYDEGDCFDGVCEYIRVREPCPQDHICVDAECVYEEPSETCEDIGPCDDPPDDFCDENVAVVYDPVGTCEETDVGPLCMFTFTETECDEDHVCVEDDGTAYCMPEGDSCADIEPCDQPPSNYCDNNTLILYGAEGVCEETDDGPECRYESSELDCEDSNQVCRETDDSAECIDLCEDVECPARENFCDNSTAINYSGAEGQCDPESGECIYPAEDESVTECEAPTECMIDDDGNAICHGIEVENPCEIQCQRDADCGDATNLCIEFEPAEGAYCSIACTNESDCDDGFECEEITSVDGITDHQCVPVERYCTAPDCYIELWCAHFICEDHHACVPGYNFDFEDWTTSDPPPAFGKSIDSDFEIIEENTDVNTGLAAARLVTSAGNNNRDLRTNLFNRPDAIPGTDYTLHQWVLYEGPSGWYRQGITFFDQDGERIGNRVFGPLIEEDHGWRELTIAAEAPDPDPPQILAQVKPFLRIRHQSGNEPAEASSSLVTDDWALTTPYTFDLQGPSPDPEAVSVAGGRTYIQAAINNEGILYVASNIPGSIDNLDRIIYIWLGRPHDTVSHPWNKGGLMPGVSEDGTLFAIAQKEETGQCEWLLLDTTNPNAPSTWVSLPGGVFCNDDPESYLAGIINLAVFLGAEPENIPPYITFAAANYGPEDGDTMISQVPASLDGDENIDSQETETVHRASLLAGKVH